MTVEEMERERTGGELVSEVCEELGSKWGEETCSHYWDWGTHTWRQGLRPQGNERRVTSYQAMEWWARS